jgi:hypothetical protein
MDTWGIGVLAGDAGPIVAEFSASAWTHGRPPMILTLLPHDSVLTVEVSDGVAWRRSPGPARRGRPRSPCRCRAIRIHVGTQALIVVGPCARTSTAFTGIPARALAWAGPGLEHCGTWA